MLKFLKRGNHKGGNSYANQFIKRTESRSYKGKSNLIFEKESFELLEDILEDASELNERVAYEDLVTTEYAEKAAEK